MKPIYSAMQPGSMSGVNGDFISGKNHFTKTVILIICVLFFTLSGTGQTQLSPIAPLLPASPDATQILESAPGPVIICPAGEFSGLHRTPVSQEIANRMGSRAGDTPCATFIVTYDNFPVNVQAAFQEAVDIWAHSITGTQPILIHASWEDLGDETLGQAGPTSVYGFQGSPIAYPVALMKQIANTSSLPNAPEYDIEATFNSAFDWYFDTDGNTPVGQIDFVSVVIHEIGHGLGFFSSAQYNAPNEGSLGFNESLLYGVYDQFMLQGINGTPLISLTEGVALGNAFTSNNVYCSSEDATAANNNAQPKLYAPNPWDGGSSMSHLDEATFIPGDENSLMTPAIGPGESNHNPGSITLGLFADMGWVLCTSEAVDCPDLGFNIGDVCDDGNAETENDTVTADCECIGTPIAVADCENESLYPPAATTPNSLGLVTSISTCNYLEEYSIITGVVSGYDYAFAGQENTSGNLAFITVRTGAIDGAVVGAGMSPLTVTAPSNADLFVHWNSDADCGTTSSCATTTVTCVTCATIPDCAGVPGGTAQPGTACNDGNVGTVNDMYDADCNCAGDPATEASICETAIPVECNADPVTYSSAESNGTNTTECTLGDNGLWFSFVGMGGDITINTTASFDHELSINSGDCDALVNIGCEDGSTGAETYTILSSILDEMYYVYIARYNDNSTITGDITIDIDCATPPACTSPELSLSAQDAAGEPIEGCIEAGAEYYVLATLDEGAGNDSYNVVTNGGAPVEVDANGSIVLGPFTQGTNVNVTAVGAQDVDCSVSASINSPALCPPANDGCANATEINCGDTIIGNTTGATASGLSSTCNGWTSSDAKDLFYTFEADGTSDYLISLSQPSSTFSFDGVLFVYSGVCDDLTSLGCDDSGDPEEMSLLAPAAGTYTIRIFDYAGTSPFTLTFLCMPNETFDCPALTANIGDSCDDLDASTDNDIITADCECVGTITYDCPALTANIGDSCDDLDASTDNDIITADCECAGTITYDCPALTANIGDSCDDLDASTDNDLITADCECVGTITYDCPALTANIGDSCDDLDASTDNDLITADCECIGVLPAPGYACFTAIPLFCNDAAVTHSAVSSNAINTSNCSIKNNGLWFTFEGTGYDITVTSTATFSHQMSFNTGSCDELVNIGCQKGSLDYESYTVYNSVPNEVYYVYVGHEDVSGSETGEITIEVNCSNPPLCEAPSLDLIAVDETGTALTECLPFGTSWYILATLSGGSGNDTYMVFVDGYDSYTEVDSGSSVILGPLAPGSSIGVQAIGLEDSDCMANADLDSPAVCETGVGTGAANDEACNAITLLCGQSFNQSFTEATQSVVDDCGGSSVADVWFTFTIDGAQGAFEIENNNSDMEIAVQFFEGSCDNLTEIIPCTTVDTEYFLFTQPGTYYYRLRPVSIEDEDAVVTIHTDCIPYFCPDLFAFIGDTCDDGNPDTVNDIVGEFCECTGEPQAANDEVCTATMMVCGDFIVQNFEGATPSMTDNCEDSPRMDIWFSFVSDGTQKYTIGVAETSMFYGFIQVFEGDDCNNLNLVRECAQFPKEFDVNEAGTYYFRLSTMFDDDFVHVQLTCSDFDCQELEMSIGDSCDDGNPGTIGDSINDDCNCEGKIPVPGDSSELAIPLECNADPVSYSNSNSVATNSTECDLADGGIWFSFVGTGADVWVYSSSTINYARTIVKAPIGSDYEDCTHSVSDFTGSRHIPNTISGETYYVYVAPWLENPGQTGVFTVSLECSYTCPALSANIGDACDDANADTENDTITADCECIGTITYDCPALTANIGDACDDGNADTENDTITADCECLGTITYDCPALIANIGDTCDDGNSDTENDTITADCECIGTITYDCPALIANIGDACDDANAETENDTITADCECLGEPTAVAYCAPEATNSARYINNFSTASGSQNISNLFSGFSAGGYGDFTSLTAAQGAGGAINFSTAINGGTAGFRIWVDWNHDGQFDIVNEVAYQSTGYASTHSGSFIVPADALEGPTRMRVVSHWLSATGSVDPCITGFTYGEFEDYTFSVSDAIYWDCPVAQANIGTPCDDGDEGTINEVYDEDCNCSGGIPTGTNDEPCVATALACGDTLVQSMIGSTSSLDDACFGTGTADVWFSFSTDGTQIVTVAEISSFDAVVQLFSGDDCENLVEAGACKDGPENYTITEAGNYYFRVRPYSSVNEDKLITVSLSCVDYDCPTELVNVGDACDDGNPNTFNDVWSADCECAGELPTEASICETAIPVECNADPVTYSSAESNGTNTTECTLGDNGLWFSFVGTGGDITINTTASFDHELSINSGDCDALVNIGCDDGSTGAETYTISSSILDEMYYVYIARYNDNSTITGDITIDIDCAIPPACTAPELTLAVQDAAGEPIDGCVEASTEYYVLAALAGGEGNDSYNVTANGGDAVAVDANGSVVLGPFSVGDDVSVVAVGAQDDECDVSASISSPDICAPANDECANAIAVQCGEAVSGSTLGASATALGTCGTSLGAGPGVWYSLSDFSGTVSVTTCSEDGPEFDTKLGVFTGLCGELVCLAGNDDAPSSATDLDCTIGDATFNRSSFVEFEASADETYYIYVTGFLTNAGNFDLTVSCQTVDCESPELTLAAVDAEGNAIGDCMAAGSAYYVSATLNGGSGNNSYNVSANGGEAVEVVADGSIVLGPFTQGTDVDVDVTGAQDDNCNISASIDSPDVCPPANDDCANATEINCGDTIIGNTTGATASGLSNTCNGWTSSDARDLFYTFEADGTSDYLISLSQPSGTFSLDGVLFVYSGVCDDLTSLGCDDSGDPEEMSLLAPAAGTYTIRIFDYAGTSPFTLTFLCTPNETFDCPALTANIGDSCDDLDASTDNDTITADCECVGTITYDCPTLTANIGDACDDGNADTENDTITADCECVGTITYDCPTLTANIGDSCDDLDASTDNDLITGDCECVGTITYDCPALTANIGDSCDDLDASTDNDLITADCECVGTITYDCPTLTANIGDACDDGNADTENDIITADCECVGTIVYDCPDLEVNNGDPCTQGGVTGEYVDCECVIEEFGSLGGHVADLLECGSRNITISIYNLDQPELNEVFVTTIDAEANFATPAFPTGTYSILVKVDGYLAILYSDLIIESGSNVLDISGLIFGDLNNTNNINILDVSVMCSAFGSTLGDANYMTIADLNCDGFINLLDFSLLNVHFGSVGANPPTME